MLTVEIADRETLAAGFVNIVERTVTAAITARGRATMAISGGSVAAAFCPSLAHARIPWAHTHIFWCDERAVPLESLDSNAGELMRCWARSIAAREARLHPMPAGAADPGAAALEYERELASVCGEPAVLDLALLGAGEDGHIASLFPAGFRDDDERSVRAVHDAPKPPRLRMTLTLPVFVRARDVVVATFGESKAPAIHDALAGRSGTPLARLIRRRDHTRILLDPASASLLGKR
jgi:6-phosphogluconolactonase